MLPIIAVSFSSLLAAPPELAFEARLKALAAASPQLVSLATIGESRQGRALHIATITDRAGTAEEQSTRPAFVIVAGIDGRHAVGTATAVAVAEQLAKDHAELLKSTRFIIIPCLNPDNLAWHLDAGHPRTDYGRTFVPHDADHDARVNEDPTEDVNGDGAITLMRVKDPAPGSDLRAEYCIDPDNPKLLKKPDAAKGQRAAYAVLTEGTDNDGDGKFNEDGIGGAGGGTDINMNFPYRWPEFSDGAGPYPLSEPESLAMANWLVNQNNIVAVIAYAPGDSLINIPQAGRFEQSGSLPLGIEDGDKAAYEEVSKLFKDATKMTGAPGLELAGSLTGWAYAIEGTLSFSTPVWVRPDLARRDEPKKEAPEGEKKDNEPKPEGAAAPGEASPNEVQNRIREFQNASPQERERMMREFNNLSPEQQARFRSAAGGQIPGGQPAAGGQPPAGGPPGGRPGGGGGRRGGGGGRFGPPGAGGGGGAAATEDKKAEPDSDDPKWLKYDADQVKAGATSGFVDWKPFKHPQLGDVEVGGFMPGFKLNPPEAELPRLAEEQTKFITTLAGKVAKLEVKPGTVERLGPGLWKISMRVVNNGTLASMPQVNTKARHGLPSILSLDVALDRIVSGEKIVRSWVIAPGGNMDAEWTLSADDGSTVNVNFRPSLGAKSVIKVELKESGK